MNEYEIDELAREIALELQQRRMQESDVPSERPPADERDEDLEFDA